MLVPSSGKNPGKASAAVPSYYTSMHYNYLFMHVLALQDAGAVQRRQPRHLFYNSGDTKDGLAYLGDAAPEGICDGAPRFALGMVWHDNCGAGTLCLLVRWQAA